MTSYHELAKPLEQHVLTHLWAFGELRLGLLTEFQPNDFVTETGRKYFDCMKRAATHNEDPTKLLQQAKLPVSYLIEKGVISYMVYDRSAAELKKLSQAYHFYSLCERTAIQLQKPPADPMQHVSTFNTQLMNIANHYQLEKADVTDIVEELMAERAMYQKKKEDGKHYIGLEMGYPKLDNAIDGLRPGHFIVLGGYTSSGKTFFALNVAKNLLEQNHKVVFYSLEMTRVDILKRIIGLKMGMNGLKIVKSTLESSEQEKLRESQKWASERALKVYTSYDDLDKIKLSMRQHVLTDQADVFFIDYLQLIQCTRTKNEYETLSTASIELQRLAQELNRPVFALSQVSNASASGSQNSAVLGFKGSGAIAASADLGIELQHAVDKLERDQLKLDKKPIPIDLHIKKNRHGFTGEIPMYFEGRTGRFTDEDPDLADF